MTKKEIVDYCEVLMGQIGPNYSLYAIAIRIANGESYTGSSRNKAKLWKVVSEWYYKQLDASSISSMSEEAIRALGWVKAEDARKYPHRVKVRMQPEPIEALFEQPAPGSFRYR
jgi:hypothetical protein